MPGPRHISGIGFFPYKNYKDVENKYTNITSMGPVDRHSLGIMLNSPERLYQAEFMFRDSSEIEAIKKDKMFTNWNITEERPIQICHTIHPEEPWLYKYKDKIIKCKYCKAKFSYTKLQEDYVDCPVCGCGETHIVNICPKCKTHGCCEVEYEDID